MITHHAQNYIDADHLEMLRFHLGRISRKDREEMVAAIRTSRETNKKEIVDGLIHLVQVTGKTSQWQGAGAVLTYYGNIGGPTQILGMSLHPF